MKKEYLRNAIRMMKKETLQEAFKKADSRNELKESLAYNRDEDDLEEGAYPGDPNDIEGLMQDDPLGAAPVMPGKVAALQKHLDGLRSRNSGLPLSDEVKAAMSQLVQALRNQGLEVNEGLYKDRYPKEHDRYRQNVDPKGPKPGTEEHNWEKEIDHLDPEMWQDEHGNEIRRSLPGGGSEMIPPEERTKFQDEESWGKDKRNPLRQMQEMKKLVRMELKKYLKKKN